MNIGELSIRKTDDLGHKYSLIITHPTMDYFGILEVGLLDPAPNFQRYWPVERQHTPIFTLTLGLLKSIQTLSFNNFYSSGYDITDKNKFYYDICFYLAAGGIGIAINLILNQIAIIDTCSSSFTIVDIGGL